MIEWQKKIKDKAVRKFLMSKPQPYWIQYTYRGKTYIMTFQNNIYRCYE